MAGESYIEIVDKDSVVWYVPHHAVHYIKVTDKTVTVAFSLKINGQPEQVSIPAESPIGRFIALYAKNRAFYLGYDDDGNSVTIGP